MRFVYLVFCSAESIILPTENCSVLAWKNIQWGGMKNNRICNNNNRKYRIRKYEVWIKFSEQMWKIEKKRNNRHSRCHSIFFQFILFPLNLHLYSLQFRIKNYLNIYMYRFGWNHQPQYFRLFYSFSFSYFSTSPGVIRMRNICQ